MVTYAEEFAHGTEHLQTDYRQSRLTLVLLGGFATLMALLMVYGLRAM